MIFYNVFDDALKFMINSKNLFKVQLQNFERHEIYVQKPMYVAICYWALLLTIMLI